MNINVYLHADPIVVAALGRIEHALSLLTTQGAKMAADIAEVKKLLDDVVAAAADVAAKQATMSTDVTTAVGVIQEVKAKLDELIAGGGTVTAADLQELADKLGTVKSSLTDSATALDSAATTLDAAAKAADITP